jgi:hypothetical protein
MSFDYCLVVHERKITYIKKKKKRTDKYFALTISESDPSEVAHPMIYFR